MNSTHVHRYVGTVFLVTAGYFGAAMVGLTFAIPPGSATAVWPPSGIALAAISLLGVRFWPGVWFAATLANLTTGVSAATAMSLGTGNTLEALVGAWLLRRLLPAAPFQRTSDAFIFVAVAAISCLPAASLGVGVLMATGRVQWLDFPANWWTWWLGDLAGQVILAPLLFALAGRRSIRLPWPRWAELVVLCGVQMFLSLLVFGGWLPERVAANVVYFPMITLMWVCLRFEFVEVTAVIVLFSLTAIWGTSVGVGAYGTQTLHQSLFDLQILLNTYAVTGLTLASIVAGRRQADAALWKSHDELKEAIGKRGRAEAWFGQLLATTPDALLVCGGDGNIVLANGTAEHLFGYSQEELLGQSIEILVPQHKRERHRTHRATYNPSPYCRLMGNGSELTACRKGGRKFPVEIALGPLETEEGPYVFCAVRDITSRKLSERSLRESEERFALAVRGTDAGIWDWDLRANTVYFSPRWKSMLGYEEYEVHDDLSEWESRLHREDREEALATINAYLGGASSNYELEHRLRHKDGTYRWILARGAAVRDEQGKPYRMVGSHIDITDLKRAEAAIRVRDAELLAAQRIQEHLLPGAAPDIPGYDIAGAFHSAEFAGGDHFDFLNLPDGNLGVVIGDVSGHGFSSALLMASTHAHIRSIAAVQSQIGDILGRVNSVLCDEFDSGRFVTMLLARIDIVSGTLSYVNAGHPAGHVLAGSGAVKAALRSTTLPLGIHDQSCLTASGAIQLEAGDIVFLCTDGLLEAASPARDMFGPDRAISFIRDQHHRSANDIVTGLYESVRAFTGRDKLVDDFTAVIIKKLR